MGFFGMQVPPPPSGSIDPLAGWAVAVLFSALSAAIGVLWRQTARESKRKDELIDRLLAQVGKAAKATEMSVTHAEREREKRVG